ncbi:asparagine synthase (glutamine-hydrolyzing) [Mycobacterium intermedium]|uniref:asparagine synthase (glutamine-hydrolyzing) n=1 Tax=Mycobacterium intermedium TaxID=28445 RepID=A0A1E3SL16_MYCIE|nr:N-acetylglutaminylglutamine amidotransferase [Mycobacterium intermedium]MCV6963459.1 N-acetylglutaminylglutamine amidotransferase [Mycobacterium intermedium]ODR02845.1 asparagine synthase (glutamine-hydrolyzing) [Mycobacterium intermedium]OPE49927.1 asparagine synthase (glutamine-hydrolyzing) [Mycobacterium intermedium]ORB02778.1 asparagine synthase (glutamine-hydrolyzing) [Mycobacterium intermedium]
MCGICGEIRWDGRSADVAAVGRMVDAMTSRGPDGSGVVAHGAVAFGHRRLSIIDLSTRGSQPMVDSDLALTLVFNGCIYNYKQLREELQAAGYRFFSTADSEVVIKAFHKWGPRCVDRFKGMFAFAIVDQDSGVVTLARDRLGIKPLYLAASPGRLRFASSVRALLDAGGVDTELDRHALHHYMSFHAVVPAPRTIYRGVRKLPPATVRVIQPDGSHTDTVYWNPAFGRDPERASWSAGDWQDALLGALRASVSLRMVADVPVGVLLSGGIDSSIVVALLAEQGQHGLATFSIGFDSAAGESGDEYVYSDLIAKTFDTDHHKIHIDSSRLLPAVPKTIAAMSEPMVSHDCVAFYLLSEEVSKSVKVVQSGQGADEILAGYTWYPPLANVAREQTTEAYAKVFFDRDHSDVLAIFAPEYAIDVDASRDFVAAHQSAPGADSAVDAALRLDTQVMLVDDPVKRVDTMTMAWGLEARVPFLDHDFVELAATCPPELKLASGGKGVLKDAARALLPSEVIDRTKGYFPVPGIRHLEGELLDMVRDALTNDAARSRGLYRAETVAALLADPNKTRTTLDGNTLWQLGVLEMWLQSMAG